MDRGEERFKERLNPDPFYDDQPLNELECDVHAALERGVKPRVAAPDFNRYTNGGKEKGIADVRHEEDQKQQKRKENVNKAKSAYGVGTVFRNGQAPTAKKKKGQGAKKGKKTGGVFESAQDEVERYLAELGLD